MKANQKFMSNDEEAVSPVIAVILMVAITVVLAATVYVWVSGFSNNSGSASASISVAQVGSVVPTTGTTAKFTVTSVSAGFAAGNLKVIDATDGVSYAYSATAIAGKFTAQDDSKAGDANALAAGAFLGAGDMILVTYAAGTLKAGSSLQLVDTSSNNVIASIYVR